MQVQEHDRAVTDAVGRLAESIDLGTLANRIGDVVVQEIEDLSRRADEGPRLCGDPGRHAGPTAYRRTGPSDQGERGPPLRRQSRAHGVHPVADPELPTLASSVDLDDLAARVVNAVGGRFSMVVPVGNWV